MNSDSRRISTADYANQILNYERFESLTSKTKDISQEIRLASVDPIGIFDYTIGGFYSRSKGNFGLGGLPGAFLWMLASGLATFAAVTWLDRPRALKEVGNTAP